MKRSFRRGTAGLLLATMAACSVPDGELEERGGALRPEQPKPGDDTGPQIPKEIRDAIAAMNAGLAERWEYLNKTYPNERGQSQDWKKTLYAGLLDVYTTAKNKTAFGSEFCTAFYTDKYGYFYYLAPERGGIDENGAPFCEVDTGDILRPEWKTVRAYAHSHLLRDQVKSPLDESLAKDNNFEVWTILSNGELYYYIPKNGGMKPKLYGKIDKGHVKTAYNNVNDIHIAGYDPYVDDGGDGFLSDAWKWVLGGLVAVGGGIVALIGGASSTDEPCCLGPPATGYDPASDPLRVCRRSDGGDCT